MVKEILALLLLLANALGALAAEPWQARLKSGEAFIVDPETRRATLAGPARGLPLWDGRHVLADGSVVTVRGGVLVSDTGFMKHQAEAPRPPPAAPLVSYCRILRLKACGLYGECAGSPACVEARAREQAYRAAVGHRGRPSWAAPVQAAEGSCLAALGGSGALPSCPRRGRGGDASPCARLVDRVCGPRGRCAGAPACAPARQLADLEYQERVALGDARAHTPASAECGQALADEDFFVSCESRSGPP